MKTSRESVGLLRRLRSPFTYQYSTFAAGKDSPVVNGQFSELFYSHEGRLVHKWSHYLPIYEQLFSRFQQGFPLEDGISRSLRFLEIGVSHGGSLELWRRYFGADATIFGVDVDPRCATVGRSDLQVRIGSQSNSQFLSSVVSEMGGVDVILDDGSHIARHQRASFDTLFPLLTEGGLYVAEDTHTAYWPSFGGGLRRPGTYVQMAKGMIDGMHGWYFRSPRGRRFKIAQHEIESIEFFDSIVAIRKMKRNRPTWLVRGTPSL